MVGSSYSSWDIPIDQGGSQDIEGDECPDNLEPEKASLCRRVFGSPFPILLPKTRVFPEGPDMLSDTWQRPGETGVGRRRRPERRGEN